jgi:hypothetical protein
MIALAKLTSLLITLEEQKTMTFQVTPVVFAQLEKQLADSGQAVMTADPSTVPGTESGVISHGGVKAAYNYTGGTLTVNVVQGGNFVVNHVIHSKVQDAIDALTNAA